MREPEGTAILLCTPLARSRRFASVEAIRDNDSLGHAVLIPLAAVAAALTVARALLSPGAFLPLLAVGLPLGLLAGYIIYARGRHRHHRYALLSWEESVALDDRPVAVRDIARDLGMALACTLLLAFFGYFLVTEPSRLTEEGATTLVVAAVFYLGLLFGLLAGLISAVQRVRFIFTRRKLERAGQ